MDDLRRWVRLVETQTSLQGRWYHGTGSLEQLRKIAASGLQARRSNYRGAMASVAGRIYLSTSPLVAQVYSLRNRPNPKFCFIAEFAGSDIINPHPDEDGIVRFLNRKTRCYVGKPPSFEGSEAEAPIWDDLTASLSAAEIATFRSKNIRAATQLAKTILPKIKPDTARYLISSDFTVAAEGAGSPLACWVIPVGAIRGMEIPPEAIPVAEFRE